MSFSTPIVLSGPLREPKQMLAEQEYGGHVSIHDDDMAEKLGFQAGPIEGPTHFSQFAPLLLDIFGQAFFERGCISTHYLNMVVEGEQVRAFAERPQAGSNRARLWAEKADGTPVLEASATLGPDHGATLLEERMAKLRPHGPLVILENLQVGMKGAADEHVRMDADQHMGKLYPFSLNDKLKVITENSPWYADPSASPWGRPIIPFEMISVLAEYSSRLAKFPVKGPAVGLFADLEIRLIDGPLFVGEDYIIRREIAALAESRRTESYWTRSRIYDKTGTKQVAEVLLNHASLKHSYEGYDDELKRLSA
ncbi:MAG: hypothetical protein QNI84_16060 [Henriciella sp.]|nr:hypothetical protein [Henriciella sp.]